MRGRTRFVLLAGLFGSLVGRSATIIGGSTFAYFDTSLYTAGQETRMTLTTDTGITINVIDVGYVDATNMPSCQVNAATCAFDFSPTFSFLLGSGPGARPPAGQSVIYPFPSSGFSVTSNGSTYTWSPGSTYTLSLDLSFIGPTNSPGTNEMQAFQTVFDWYHAGGSFTASGSFSLMDGSTTLLSDTLETTTWPFASPGIQTAYWYGEPVNGWTGASINESFATVPEPSSAFTVSLGLLLGFFYWSRTRNSRRQP